MALPGRIPVFLLSGFLGSGKSTLLNDLLRDPAFGDTAVIINEFGDVAVDHLLVREGRTAVSRVATGCLCCSGSTDLRATLLDLHLAAASGSCPPFSRVIVEMSGLGDPAPLVNALAQAPETPGTERDRAVDDLFHLAGIVTLYDIVTGPVSLERHFEALKQLAFADRIVLTKTDLARDRATQIDVAALPEELARINVSAPVVDRRRADLAGLFAPRPYMAVDRGEDVAGWLALERVLAAEAAQDGAGHRGRSPGGRHGAGIRTFSITRAEAVPENRFRQFISVLRNAGGRRLLRVKGIVCIAEDPHRPRIVHAVQHLASRPVTLDRWPGGDRRTRLVFITDDVEPESVRSLFSAVVDGSPVSFAGLLARLGGYLSAPATSFRSRFARLSRRST